MSVGRRMRLSYAVVQAANAIVESGLTSVLLAVVTYAAPAANQPLTVTVVTLV